MTAATIFRPRFTDIDGTINAFPNPPNQPKCPFQPVLTCCQRATGPSAIAVGDVVECCKIDLEQARIEHRKTSKRRNPMHRRLGRPSEDPCAYSDEESSYDSGVHTGFGPFCDCPPAINRVAGKRNGHRHTCADYLGGVSQADLTEIETVYFREHEGNRYQQEVQDAPCGAEDMSA